MDDYDDFEPPAPIEPQQVGMRSFVALLLLLWVSFGAVLWSHHELAKPLQWPDKFARTVKPPRSGGVTVMGAWTNALVTCYTASASTASTNGTGASCVAGSGVWDDPSIRSIETEKRLYNDEWSATKN